MRTPLRSRPRITRRTGLSLVSAAVLVLGLTTALPTAQGTPGPVSVGAVTAGERTVSYHGYQVAVPADWKVVDLAADPAACLRFDTPAVYVGRPAEQQNCPAHLTGRTAGLVIEPLADAKPRAAAVAASPRTAVAPASAVSTDDQLQVAVEDAGVLVTAVHGPSQEPAVRRVLGTGRLVAGGSPATLSAPEPKAAVAPAATIVAPGTMINQQAFDQCTAPSLNAMNAWKASPFRAVGIYISGASRSCTQANLTASWVAANSANGWSFMPIDVGYQAPCEARQPKMSYDPATARRQGADSAAVTAQAAINLGIGPGSALYSDIEAYTPGTACTAAVLSYVSGWTTELRARGFLAGVYSSAGSGGRDLANAVNDSRYVSPDHLWFAWWNGVADTDGGPYIADNLWTNHQRLHQYRGDHNETWGGVTINIDSNVLDVAEAGPPAPMTDGTYRIRAEVGGYDLDVVDCQTQNGADVRVWFRILSSPCQQWRVERVSGTTFKILDGNSGKALEVAGCTTTDATPVQLWDDYGGTCQTWTIEPVFGGAYKVTGTASGKSLDVAACSPKSGADVIIWPFHGGTCQRWSFTPA